MNFARLDRLLFEASDKRSYSWLDLHGNFNLVPRETSHQTWAMRYVENKKIDIGSENKGANAYNYLMKLGWQRISDYSDVLYSNNDCVILPNQNQKKMLIRLAFDINAKRIEFDGRPTGRVIIWSRDS